MITQIVVFVSALFVMWCPAVDQSMPPGQAAGAQSSPKQPVTHIEDLSITSLLLKALDGDETTLGYATGFILQKGQNYYLVTNRHVVTNVDPLTKKPIYDRETAPVKLAILHNAANSLGMWIWKVEALLNSKTGRPRWLTDPQRDTTTDIVALPLTNLEGVKCYPLDLKLTEAEIYVGPAEQVSVVGFPYADGAGGGLAIWKSGTVASDPEVNYGGKPMFLIDATTRKGMSGSPVYARRSGAYLNPVSGAEMVPTSKPVTKFLGVYSAQHALSELGLVWKAEVIVELYDSLP